MLSHDQWFLLFYYLVMGNLVVGIPTLLLLGAFLPKDLKQRYFCVPYYRAAEMKWLSVFPLSLIAYASLGAMFVWPRLGRKRQIIAKGNELGLVYRMVMQVYFWLTVITVPAASCIFLGLLV